MLVNQHYHPDLSATAVLLTDLAQHLAVQGYRVTVLCARNSYGAGRIVGPARETHKGVEIRRFWAPGLGRASKARRLLDYLSFVIQASAYLLLVAPVYAIVTLTTPPLVPVVGDCIKRLRKLPHVIWSMDLHPEAEVAAGMLKRDGLLGRWLHYLASRAYRNADHVIALGPAMRSRIIGKGVSASRVDIVSPWADAARLNPVNRADNELERRIGIPKGCFVVMYSGNAGIAHDFTALLDAAAGLQESDTLFLFAGGGSRREEVVAAAKALSVENLRYVDYFPHTELASSLSLGDVHVVTLRPEFGGISVPAKLYGAMAVSRPVLFIGPAGSETALTVTDARCGVVIDPAEAGDPAACVRSALERWKADAQERVRAGRRGREFLIDNCERSLCCAKIEEGLRRSLGAVVGPPSHS